MACSKEKLKSIPLASDHCEQEMQQTNVYLYVCKFYLNTL